MTSSQKEEHSIGIHIRTNELDTINRRYYKLKCRPEGSYYIYMNRLKDTDNRKDLKVKALDLYLKEHCLTTTGRKPDKVNSKGYSVALLPAQQRDCEVSEMFSEDDDVLCGTP